MNDDCEPFDFRAEDSARTEKRCIKDEKGRLSSSKCGAGSNVASTVPKRPVESLEVAVIEKMMSVLVRSSEALELKMADRNEKSTQKARSRYESDALLLAVRANRRIECDVCR
jgi:hypothetical protein